VTILYFQADITSLASFQIDQWQSSYYSALRKVCDRDKVKVIIYKTRSSGKNQQSTFFWYETHRIENDASNNSSIVSACIRYGDNFFT
jgi:ectoine hydroxylase-related dioxygenase (phytanoyl-CoA dioxygenase family)